MVEAISEGFGPANALPGEADGEWRDRYEFAEDVVLAERRRATGSIWRLSVPRQAN